MNRKIILTGDGSHTVSVPELNLTYHSIHGAIQESQHVFIQAGLIASKHFQRSESFSILEVGFGTGLNALLTLMNAGEAKKSIYYVALEPFPIPWREICMLNYCEQLNRRDLEKEFIRMHECEWEKSIAVSENVLLHKANTTFQTFESKTKFNLIYFDAFAPNAQPELWTKEVFEKMYPMLQPGGILVTYCSKGHVRRNMIAAGFEVEKLPGPAYKREMIRARTKIN